RERRRDVAAVVRSVDAGPELPRLLDRSARQHRLAADGGRGQVIRELQDVPGGRDHAQRADVGAGPVRAEGRGGIADAPLRGRSGPAGRQVVGQGDLAGLAVVQVAELHQHLPVVPVARARMNRDRAAVAGDLEPGRIPLDPVVVRVVVVGRAGRTGRRVWDVAVVDVEVV